MERVVWARWRDAQERRREGDDRILPGLGRRLQTFSSAREPPTRCRLGGGVFTLGFEDLTRRPCRGQVHGEPGGRDQLGGTL